MITQYHRPDSLESALSLLRRPALTLPMGGGTVLNAPHDLRFSVVDLQELGLDKIETRGKFLQVGAAASLQSLAAAPDCPAELGRVIRLEATANLRNQGSVAGTLVSADGRSPFGCAVMALAAELAVDPGDETIEYGQLLQLRSGIAEGLPHLPGRLIRTVTFNSGAELAYEFVARSPADRPVVCAAAAAWPSGRLRLVVGGWGSAPRLALDASDPGGVAEAAASAAAEAADAWASAEYRREAAAAVARRAVERLGM